MSRQPVDLCAHINQTVERGHPADFPVGLVRVYHERDGAYEQLPHRLAVTRLDTGQVLAVVSDRYELVPHQRVLDLVEQTIAPLDVGPVPRGVFVDRQGSRMRAIFKFPALARPVLHGDDICPCLKIQNTYDGTSRIAIHIGAFRFVCTNLAVGGGGVFAGGFMSVHAGEIPLKKVAEQLASYLKDFEAIVALYGFWARQPLNGEALAIILEFLPVRAGEAIRQRIDERKTTTVYAAYNVATDYATHETRSFRTAFELLAQVNQRFQACFPGPAPAA